MDTKKALWLKLIKENTFETMGCTDPVSIILASSAAYNQVGGDVKKINLVLDKNIYKNAFSVIIPGTKDKGLELAASLGTTLKNWEKRLIISEDIDEEKLQKAKEIKENVDIDIKVNYDTDEIYIKAEIITDKGTGTCLIQYNHNNITLLKSDDKVIIENLEELEEISFLDSLSMELDFKAILEMVEDFTLDEIEFIEEGINYNMDAAQQGLIEKTGLGIGYQLSRLIDEGKLDNNVINRSKMLAAGAADARMGGLKSTVMGCFGSGNHGISLFIPLKVLSDELGCSKEKLLKSIVIGEILTAHIKKATGIITPHCGAIIATGVGLAGGVSYLQDYNQKQMEDSIRLFVGNLYGVICDGAKPSCALKIISATQAAFESSFMAKDIGEFDAQGVVGSNLPESLRNLEFLITKEGRDSDVYMVELLEKTQE